jgi:hypothetical protein
LAERGDSLFSSSNLQRRHLIRLIGCGSKLRAEEYARKARAAPTLLMVSIA